MADEVKTGRMTGRLGTFQRTMLLWNSLHPYNAVHVVRLPGPLDLPRLTALITDCLERFGLTNLTLNARRRRFEYAGGPAGIDVRCLDPGASCSAAIDAEIQTQLETPFPIDRPFTPFRFFVMPEGGRFALGLAYCHFIADADPVVALLTHLAQAYCDDRTPPPAQPLDRYVNTARCLRPILWRHGFLWALRFPGFLKRILRSSKPRYIDRTDHRTGFASFTVPMATFETLLQLAKAWGVSLHDVFLAALLKAIVPFAEERVRTTVGKRKLIALSSIAGIRRDLAPAAAKAFGLFLGNFVTFHPLPEGVSLEQAACAIHDQTAVIKKRRLYLRTLMELRLALFMIPRYAPARQQKMYRQHYPVWGGITNMNLMPALSGPAGRVMLDYLRAVSTGPVCPLVMAITTCNNALNIGMTFRRTVYPDDAARRIQADFAQLLSQPTGV